MNRRELVVTALTAVSHAWVPRAFAATSGITDREITIGQSAVLSGPLGEALKVFNAGASMVWKSVNAAGGIHGRKLRMVSLDDALKPDLAVANYKDLLAKHQVFAFFGGVGSATVAAAAPVLRESGAPLIGNYALSDTARAAAQDVAYFVRATYSREADALIEHLASIGLTRVAVASLANPGGDEVAQFLRTAIAKRIKGTSAAAYAGVQNDGKNAAQAAKVIAEANPQAVAMFLGGPPVAELMKAVRAAGVQPNFYGMSTVNLEQTSEALGKGLTGGLSTTQIVPFPMTSKTAAAAAFQRSCAANDLKPSYAGFEGYLNAMVLVEALTRAGTQPTRAALHAAVRQLKTNVGGLDVDFTTPRLSGSNFVDVVFMSPDGRVYR